MKSESPPQPADTDNAETALNSWIRGRFIDLNSALEDRYEAQTNRSAITGVGDDLKQALLTEGEKLCSQLLANYQPPTDFPAGFEVLGNVGYFLAACQRHEVSTAEGFDPSQLASADELAARLGLHLGTAPRFLTSHMETHNRAVDGKYRTFTWRPAEKIFLDQNTRSVYAYQRAAEALASIEHLGASHPLTPEQLDVAADALQQAFDTNSELSSTLDIDDFFFCVRPYYKPYDVGGRSYRGANAGDFSAFNEVDLLLGLLKPSDPSYLGVVTEKIPYLLPEDQLRLRDTIDKKNILDELLDQLTAFENDSTDASARPLPSWWHDCATAYLRVCASHGQTLAHHYKQLVEKFVQKPAEAIPAEHLDQITASGPPLSVVLDALKKLRDQRLAADRDDIPTRAADIARIRQALGQI